MANTSPTTLEHSESSGTGSATLGTGRYTTRRKRSRRILFFLGIGIVLAVAAVLLYRYFALTNPRMMRRSMAIFTQSAPAFLAT